jgi:hypothetical protein
MTECRTQVINAKRLTGKEQNPRYDNRKSSVDARPSLAACVKRKKLLLRDAIALVPVKLSSDPGAA